MKKWLPVITFLLIVAIAAFFRLYLLGIVPAGLTNDEANTGYDAYSLLLTGKDQWASTHPLSFRGFGDYPAPLYRYLLIPFIALMGPTALAIRLPSAIFGIGLAIGIFFLAKKLFPRPLAYLAMLFAAVSPWAVGMGRIGLESNVAASFLVFALLSFLNVKKNQIKFFVIGTLLLILTIYTYASYTLLAPLLFLVISAYFLGKKQLSLRMIVIGLIIFFIVLSPVLLNRNATAASRFAQIGILHNVSSVGLINVLNDQRGACQTYLPNVLCKFENNKIILFSSALFINYISHFSLDFLFINGTATQYSILYTRGLAYLFDSILFFLGLFYLLRQSLPQKGMLILLFLSAIPDSLTGPGNYSRALSMLPFLLIVEASGGYLLIQSVNKLRKTVKIILYVFPTLLFLGSVIIFAITYFTYFRDYYSRFSQYGYQQLTQQIKTNKQKYDRIYITTHLNDTKQYIYYLLYTKYDPAVYQEKQHVDFHTEPDGWISVDRIDSLYFVSSVPPVMILENLQKDDKNILLISHPSDFPKNISAVFIIKDRVNYELFEAVRMNDLLEYYSQHKLIPPDIQQ